jgi:hypothetical protein
MVKMQLLFALGTAAPPGSHPPAAPRAGGATGDTARSCWGPIRTRCTSPPRAPPHRVVFGGDSTAFFRRVVCAVERNSTQAHRSCLLVGPRARLYNLKRPKSQFWSTMGSFSMIGLHGAQISRNLRAGMRFARRRSSVYWPFYTSISRLARPHPTHAFRSISTERIGWNRKTPAEARREQPNAVLLLDRDPQPRATPLAIYRSRSATNYQVNSGAATMASDIGRQTEFQLVPSSDIPPGFLHTPCREQKQLRLLLLLACFCFCFCCSNCCCRRCYCY